MNPRIRQDTHCDKYYSNHIYHKLSGKVLSKIPTNGKWVIRS